MTSAVRQPARGAAAVVDPYRAIDRQADPRRFARILEARGSQRHQGRLRRGFLSLAGVQGRDARPGRRLRDRRRDPRRRSARVGRAARPWASIRARALLAVARRRTRLGGRAGARPKFRAGDGLALPFASASFDVALAVTVLLARAGQRPSSEEMIRVTRPGGRVAVLDQDFGTFALDVPDRGADPADRGRARGALLRRAVERADAGPPPAPGGARARAEPGLRRRGLASTTTTCGGCWSGGWTSRRGGAS